MRYHWYEWWSMRSFKWKAAQKLVLAVFVFVVAVALQTQTDLCPNRRLTWNYALVIYDTIWIFYCNSYLARFCVILWSYLLLAILVSLPWYSTHSTYSETNRVKILKMFVRDIVRGSRQLKGKKVSLFSFPEFSAWIELIFSACNTNLVTDCLSFIKSTYWLKVYLNYSTWFDIYFVKVNYHPQHL